MGTIVKPHTFTSGTTIVASEVNANFDEIINEVNGSIETTNIAAGAVTNPKLSNSAVDNTKLADSAVTNVKVAAAAAIDASKIADGTVSNAEFQRLDGVTSDIQGQIDTFIPNTGDKIYAGEVDSSGSKTQGPSSWTTVRNVLGTFTVSHSLGHTTYVPVVTVLGSGHIRVATRTSNSFSVNITDTGNNAADLDWFFQVTDLS